MSINQRLENSAKTSDRMSKVRQKDTLPELIVRRLVFGMGYRYRLHRRDLPGKPDLVFIGLRKIIFVNGCFWHSHKCRAGQNKPFSNKEFWENKLNKNKERDLKNFKNLRKDDWKVLVLWECEIKKDGHLREKIKQFLKS